MKVIPRLTSKFKEHRGATAVVVAISIAVLISFTAIAIDVAYVATTKNELQNVADAATLAAAGQLGNDYFNKLSYNRSTIVKVAQDVALENQAAKKVIIVLDSDVIIGKWTGSPLIEDPDQPNAVSVTARRDSSANSPIITFFAKIFGIDAVNVSASATAALSGPSKADVELPLGISIEWFENGCEEDLSFNPADACVAWHVFENSEMTPSAANVGNIIDNISVVEAEIGDVYYFAEGDLGEAPVFNPLEELFEDRKDDDGDGDDNVWTTTVVVFDLPCWEAGDGSFKKEGMIIGFATITITDIINDCHNKEIVADAACNIFIPGRGGGGNYGTYGYIPGLVE